MLTDSQRDIIKATVPLLEAGGEALTTHFYQGMFTTYPEVKTLFNQAHQAAGTQPRARPCLAPGRAWARARSSHQNLHENSRWRLSIQREQLSKIE